MSKIIHDLGKCIKYSLICILVFLLLGIIIGIIKSFIMGNFLISYIVEWAWRIGIYGSCFGLSISAVSFAFKNTLRPLDYQEEWETYFKKFNLSHVIFFVSLFSLIYMVIIDWIFLRY